MSFPRIVANAWRHSNCDNLSHYTIDVASIHYLKLKNLIYEALIFVHSANDRLFLVSVPRGSI